MMKINNKGLSLIELLVSLTLISIVMTILMGLLSDLKNEKSLNTDSNADAINRTTIINIIENDFLNYGLINIEGCNPTDTSKKDKEVCLNFTYSNPTDAKPEGTITKQMIVTENYLVYDSERWDLEFGTYDISNFDYCYINSYSTSTLDYYVLKITIPVKTLELNKNYDIVLTSVDKMSILKIRGESSGKSILSKSITMYGKEYGKEDTTICKH